MVKEAKVQKMIMHLIPVNTKKKKLKEMQNLVMSKLEKDLKNYAVLIKLMY